MKLKCNTCGSTRGFTACNGVIVCKKCKNIAYQDKKVFIDFDNNLNVKEAKDYYEEVKNDSLFGSGWVLGVVSTALLSVIISAFLFLGVMALMAIFGGIGILCSKIFFFFVDINNNYCFIFGRIIPVFSILFIVTAIITAITDNLKLKKAFNKYIELKTDLINKMQTEEKK